MPKKDGDEFLVSESGNWNVADSYAKSKIMEPLYFADKYETIAEFGFENFYDEINLSQDPSKDTYRINAFRRLIKTLLRLINNTFFAITQKVSKEDLKKYKEELEKIYKIIPVLYTHKVDQRKGTRILKIKEEDYQKVLDRVIEIKSLINEPLNKHDLIFTHTEEFDPRAAKEEIKKRLTEVG